MVKSERDEIELIFTREGMTIRKKVAMPFKKETWVEELVHYDNLRNINRIEILIDKVEPKIEKGILKSLRFHVAEYTTHHLKTQLQDKGIKIKNEFRACRFSKDILIETANWLVDMGYLTGNDIPVDLGGTKRYLINSQPKHRNNENFRAPHRLKNGLYIETHYSHNSCVQYARRLLKHFNLDEEDLEVIGFKK